MIAPIADMLSRRQRNPLIFALFRLLFDAKNRFSNACYDLRAAARRVRYDEDSVRESIRKRLGRNRICPKPKQELNIFAYCRIKWFDMQYLESSFPHFQFFGMDEHGYDQRAPDWLPTGRDRFQQELLAAVKEKHARNPIDVFVGYLSNHVFSVESVRAIRSLGIPVVSICWDDTTSFWGLRQKGVYRGNGPLVRDIDVMWTASRAACTRYLVAGARPIFMPEGEWPEFFRPRESERDIDVLFIGTNFGYRRGYIEFLRRHGITVKAHGSGWGTEPVSDREMVELYGRSRIVLGFAGVGPSRHFRSLKGRDFEIPMAGALYLREYSRDIDECFEVGREIMCFDSPAECLQRVRQLLADEEEAERIRQAGQQRALRDHTWEKRYDHLFRDVMGIVE